MKAYQLKIVIKNSKPPIWRRCIIPAGITFSHLSIIFNKVMGWSGYHLSEYEFYHLGLQLREDDKLLDFIPLGDYDLLDSSKTYINEYIEKQKWFTYTYDFGDHWQHRVTIEEVITDYPYNYPQVVKYKGDCPIEDCGGIYGYYDCIDVMEDDSHPESKERKEWAKSQGYGWTYSIDEVNNDLKDTCYVTFGKGEKRNQEEIYEDMFQGKYGLLGSTTAKNKELPIKPTPINSNEDIPQLARIFIELEESQEFKNLIENTSIIEDDPQLLKDKIKLEINEFLAKKMYEEGFIEKIKLHDILNSITKKDLKDIGKNYDIKYLSSLNKPELINVIEEKLLTPETMEDIFIVLTDNEIKAFEKASQYTIGYPIKDHEENDYESLFDAGYINITVDNVVHVPEDVIDLYKNINTEEFHNRRRRISWLISCFDFASAFYGEVPVHIMVKLFNKNKDMQTDNQSLIDDYDNIPYPQKEFTFFNDKFVHYDLIRDQNSYDMLIQSQGSKKFYIPSKNEIIDNARVGFLINDSQNQKMISFFTSHLGVDEEDAIMSVAIMSSVINTGGDMTDIFDYINDKGISFNSTDDLNSFIPLLNDFWNNTRIIYNRGHRPIDIFEDDRKNIQPIGSGKMPTIIPGSSSAAKTLMEGRNEIEKMGFTIDFESNASEFPVYSMPNGLDGSVEMKTKKVYPNDPCPCGSGKKYKKCHGG